MADAKTSEGTLPDELHQSISDGEEQRGACGDVDAEKDEDQAAGQHASVQHESGDDELTAVPLDDDDPERVMLLCTPNSTPTFMAAIERPSWGSDASPSHGASTSAPRAWQPSYTKIMVAPDENAAGGANFYAVDSENARGETFRVLRRFDNLVALHEDLKQAYRGCIVPGRPAKTAMNSTHMRSHGEKFLTERAHEIEAYLNRIAGHVEMKDSEALRVFMESPSPLVADQDWRKTQPKKGGLVGGLLHSLKKAVGAESSVPTLFQIKDTAQDEGDIIRMLNERLVPRRVLREHADKDEKDLETAKERVQESFKCACVLGKRAEELMEASKKLEDVSNDTAFALNELRELQARTAGGAAEAAVCEAGRDCFLRSYEALQRRRRRDLGTLSKLHHHMALLPRVHKALLAREAALISLESVRRQQEDINKSFGMLSEKELGAGLTRGEVGRMNKARADRDVVQQTVAAASEHYLELKRRNLRDVADYQRELNEDICSIAANLAFDHEQHAEREAALWAGLAESLGADVAKYGQDFELLEYDMLEPVMSASTRLVDDGSNKDGGPG